MADTKLQPAPLDKEDKAVPRQGRVIPGRSDAPKNFAELRQFFTKLGRDELNITTARKGLHSGGTELGHLDTP